MPQIQLLQDSTIRILKYITWQSVIFSIEILKTMQGVDFWIALGAISLFYIKVHLRIISWMITLCIFYTINLSIYRKVYSKTTAICKFEAGWG